MINYEAIPLLVFYLMLALGVSFLCSILEAVILSLTPSFVANLEKKGDKSGPKLRALKEDIDRPLAAILSLNTVAHTIGASGVGVQSQEAFGSAYVTITSVVLTLLILIFSEIIPKSLGSMYRKRLARFVAAVMPTLIIMTLPLVWMSKGITRLLGGSPHHGPTLSREEFSAMADLVSEEGVFEEDESRILKNLFRFAALRVQDVMTPRTVIVAFDADETVEDLIASEESLRFSRLPVHRGTLDTISGYVLKQDVLLKSAQSENDLTLEELRRDLLILPETTNLRACMEAMLERQEHITLVVDEYGGTAGIVTMEDLVETLLGLEIVDEVDGTDDMQALARHQWERRAKRLGLVTEDLS